MTPENASRKPDRYIEIFPNGLTLILIEKRLYPVVCFDIWTRVGSRDEKREDWGMSHFLEHMVYNGSENFSMTDFKNEIFKIGGEDNAATWEDVTDFYLLVTADYFHKAVEIHSSILRSPLLDDTDFFREREVVKEEIRIYEDSPSDILDIRAEQILFRNTGYDHSILGTVQSLDAMTPDDMRRYFRQHYIPSNMLLLVIGDFDTGEVLPELRQAYGSYSGNDGPPPAAYDFRPNDEPEVLELRSDIESTWLSIAFKAPPLKSMETYALDVLMEVLGGSRSARLNARLLEELNLVTDISASNHSMMDASKLGIDIEMLDTSSVQAVIDECLSIISDVSGDGIEQEELTRAITRLTVDHVFSGESLIELSDFYGQNIMLSGLETVDNYVHRLKSVTGEQVMNAARKYFRPENMVIGVHYPEKFQGIKINYDKLRTFEPASEADLDYGSFVIPDVKKLTPNSSPGSVVKEVLPNGVTVIRKYVPENPIVAVQLCTRHGLAYETWQTNGIAELMHRALWKGTENYSADELNRKIDMIGADFSTDTELDYFETRARFLSRDFDQAFDLFSEMILLPSFPENEFEKVRDEVLGVIARELDSPEEVSVNRLRLELFGKDHPYGRPAYGREEVVKKIALESVREYHRMVTSPENIVITIVGDIGDGPIMRSIEKWFSKLEPSGYTIPEPPATMRITEIKEVFTKKDKSQVRISIGNIAMHPSDPDYIPAMVMDTIIGGTSYSRLFDIVRDREGLAYDIYTTLERGMWPGMFILKMGTAPENYSKAVSCIREQYRLLGEAGPTAEELESAVNSIRSQFHIWHYRNEAVAENFCVNETLGLGHDFDHRLLGRLHEITTDDIIRAAGKYCNPDNILISACGTL